MEGLRVRPASWLGESIVGKKKLLDESFFVAKRVGRAVHEHAMLPDGCTALVALSGGFASLTLLRALLHREKRTPTTATFVPCHVPDGVHGDEGVAETLRRLCSAWGLELKVAAPAPAEDHFGTVPHKDALVAAAREAGASVVVLGHSILDRAFGVMLPLLGQGELAELPVVETLDEGLTAVRPLCHLTPDSILAMTRAEGLPVLEPAILPPDQALRAAVLEFIESRKGRLMEKLRNLSNAPHNIVDEYMA